MEIITLIKSIKGVINMTFTLLEAHITSNNIKIMFNTTFIEKFTFFFLILKEAELMYFKNNNTLFHRYKMKSNTWFYLLYFVLITLPKLWKGFVVYWNIFPNRLELQLKTSLYHSPFVMTSYYVNENICQMQNQSILCLFISSKSISFNKNIIK